jgi:ubiquinone/menaquinone biosynthesis C-methylase UbiE
VEAKTGQLINMKSDIAIRKFFDKQAETWHESIDQTVRSRLYEIFKNKIPPLFTPLLDVGSGTGILLPVLAKNMGDHPLVIEVDLSRQMLKQNRDHNGKNLPASHIQADSHCLPFKSNQFKTIVCFAAFAHFEDKASVINDFYRILQPGGIIIILHLMDHSRLNCMHRGVGGAVRNDTLPGMPDLCALIRSQGLKILNCEETENIYLIRTQK